MIKIERNNLDDIAKEYLTKLQEKRGRNKTGMKARTHYIKNIERFVLAKPSDFLDIIKEFKDIKQNKKKIKEFKTYMKNQYEYFFYKQKIGKWLAEKLDVKTCPYCNRQYTFTIENGKKSIRPQFDHFYPKSKFPCLALSFYNLIPACPVCNHTKSEDEIDQNPYTEGFVDNFKFKIQTKGGKEDSLDWALKKEIEIVFSGTNRNIDVFALKELYNKHIDYVEEIIDKAQAYNSNYYVSLIKSYRGLGKQEADIDRFIWGNYLENAEHEKRPLSKLTKDILQQLEIK